MRTSLLVLLAACTGGLDKYGYDSNPGQDLDSVDSGGPADTADDTGAPPDENAAPVADAGGDLEVHTLDVVALDGSGSADPDGDSLYFAWTMTSRPGGSAAALAGGTTSAPSFVADVAGIYQVSLTVSDGANYSSADLVTVTASDGGSGGGSDCGCRAGPGGAAGALPLVVVGLAGLLGARRRR